VDRKRRRERFEKEAATLETQALRSQMNPHFIFNALNSINAFVQRNDQDSASSFLGKFARVMRLVLENSRHAEVPLKDDLEALRGYLELECIRMGRKFDFTITVDPSLDPEDVLVPPLVVQPFVENAIWHGMAGKEGGGHINLHVAKHDGQLRWTIEDDGAGRHAPKFPPAEGTPTKKTSLGTAITRARLDLVQKQHGGKAGFHYTDLPQGTRVEVDMPLLSAFG
jgi:LytS/YehU family sensor histidine kinase